MLESKKPLRISLSMLFANINAKKTAKNPSKAHKEYYLSSQNRKAKSATRQIDSGIEANLIENQPSLKGFGKKREKETFFSTDLTLQKQSTRTSFRESNPHVYFGKAPLSPKSPESKGLFKKKSSPLIHLKESSPICNSNIEPSSSPVSTRVNWGKFLKGRKEAKNKTCHFLTEKNESVQSQMNFSKMFVNYCDQKRPNIPEKELKENEKIKKKPETARHYPIKKITFTFNSPNTETNRENNENDNALSKNAGEQNETWVSRHEDLSSLNRASESPKRNQKKIQILKGSKPNEKGESKGESPSSKNGKTQGQKLSKFRIVGKTNDLADSPWQISSPESPRKTRGKEPA